MHLKPPNARSQLGAKATSGFKATEKKAAPKAAAQLQAVIAHIRRSTVDMGAAVGRAFRRTSVDMTAAVGRAVRRVSALGDAWHAHGHENSQGRTSTLVTQHSNESGNGHWFDFGHGKASDGWGMERRARRTFLFSVPFHLGRWAGGMGPRGAGSGELGAEGTVGVDGRLPSVSEQVPGEEGEEEGREQGLAGGKEVQAAGGVRGVRREGARLRGGTAAWRSEAGTGDEAGTAEDEGAARGAAGSPEIQEQPLATIGEQQELMATLPLQHAQQQRQQHLHQHHSEQQQHHQPPPSQQRTMMLRELSASGDATILFQPSGSVESVEVSHGSGLRPLLLIAHPTLLIEDEVEEQPHAAAAQGEAGGVQPGEMRRRAAPALASRHMEFHGAASGALTTDALHGGAVDATIGGAANGGGGGFGAAAGAGSGSWSEADVGAPPPAAATGSRREAAVPLENAHRKGNGRSGSASAGGGGHSSKPESSAGDGGKPRRFDWLRTNMSTMGGAKDPLWLAGILVICWFSVATGLWQVWRQFTSSPNVTRMRFTQVGFGGSCSVRGGLKVHRGFAYAMSFYKPYGVCIGGVKFITVSPSRCPTHTTHKHDQFSSCSASEFLQQPDCMQPLTSPPPNAQTPPTHSNDHIHFPTHPTSSQPT